MSNTYEISATLNINNKGATKAIDETVKKIKELEKGYSSANKPIKENEKNQNNNAKASKNVTKETDKLSKSVNDNDKAYKSLFKTQQDTDKHLNKLTAGLNEQDRSNKKLINSIKSTHKELINENASVEKASKKWKAFAKEKGLAYNGMNLISSNKSIGLFKTVPEALESYTKKTRTLGDVSKKALGDYNNQMAKLNTKLSHGTITQSEFHRSVANLGNYMKGTYGITVKQLGNGYSTLKSQTNSAKQALSEYTRELRSANNLINKGAFTPEARQRLATYRDTLGTLVMGQEKYNKLLSSAQTDKQGIKINVLKDIMGYMQKNSAELGINQNAINSLNGAYKRFNTNINRIGGSLADISNGTGNYNKLLTTTTRSQRMQNYAMQVAGLRYNALATTLGFVGGMLGTQLVMGFASARIEAVQFDQQAKQMFKTSKLSAKGIQSVTEAVQKYTRENRKLNTQGLTYTVAQVTKLNNLTEEQAKKIIPVVADISNMMRINGRTQEESILAVNDALDGQFKRLQEIGVGGKNMLKKYGWNGDVDDKMSLIGALEKVGKVKGWNDLTKDITTLQDAYDVLGNTIDDVVTPAMARVTPVIVNMIQGFSGFISRLWDAPVAIQGFASALGVLGIAFGKMKFEMLYARLIGSEFIASLTGLDAGMYGITRSVGSVNMAVREGAISFEEGARCLMDYHTTQIGASRTFREYSTVLGELYTEQEALTVAQRTATGVEKEQIAMALNKNRARTAELIKMRDMETAHAKYILANNNLTASQRLQLNTIRNKAGLTQKEMAQIIAVNGLIDENTKTIKVNTLAEKLNVDTTKKGNIALSSSSPILRKVRGETEAKRLALLGLNAEQLTNTGLTELGISATEKDNIVKRVAKQHYDQLNDAQRKRISLSDVELIVEGNLSKISGERVEALVAEEMAMNNCNGIMAENVALNKTKVIENEALAVSEGEVASAVTATTFAEHLHNGTMRTYIKKLAESTVATLKQAGATALMTAKFLLLTPEGWAVTAVIGALAVSAYKLFKEQMRLNAEFGKFKKLSEEVPQRVQKMEDRLKKLEETNKNGKNDKKIKQLKDEIAYYKKLEDQITKTNESRAETYETATKRIADANKELVQSEGKRSGKKVEDYTGLEGAIGEKNKIDNWITEFGLTTKNRNKKLQDAMTKSGLNDETRDEMAKEYAQAQQDVIDAMDKYDSDDFFTRVGAYWDNFWARADMWWIEVKANWGQKIDDIVGGIGDFFSNFSVFGMIKNMFLSPKERENNQNVFKEYIGNMFKPLIDYLKDLTPQKLMDDIISNVPAFKPIDIGAELIKMLLPEPVNAEGDGGEGTPLLDRIKHDLGIDKLGEWITNDVEPKFKQLGDTVNYWLDINNWLQMAEGGADFITEWWNTNIVEPFNSLLHQFGLDLHSDGATVGRKLKQGIKEGIGKLVEPVTSKIKEVIDYLTSGGDISSVKEKARKVASDMYDKFKSGLGNFSNLVQSEIDDIKNILKNAPNTISDLAGKVGSVIPEGIRKKLDRNSPGLAARETLAEMEDIEDSISSSIPYISAVAKKAGDAIVKNFGNHDLTGGLNIVQNNQDIIKSNNMASQNTVQQYNTMSNTVDQSFGEMSDNATNDMQSVADQNAQYLSKMNTDTASNMTQINSIHKSKLNTMQSSTITATNSMTRAWSSMRSSIVSSASHIQTQSYQKFNSLHRSISSFYKQIQSATFSAGNLVAGSPHRSVKFSTTRHSTNSGVAGGYAGRSEDMAYTKLLKNLSRGIATNGDIDEFYRKYNVRCLNGDCYAGGINPNAHVRKQVNYAHKWKISDPKMYGIKLPMNNAVKDFDKGKQPRITYDNFEHYLGALLNARGFRGTYQFYFNSKRSNQQVWDDVRCNCYDGAELIMEIARDMGLSNVGMLHGDWKGIRHVCATVGGKVFDMTQFQNYGVFRGTPGVSFGGAGYTGRAVKWSPSGRFAGGSTTNTTNNKTNKVEVYINGNTFIGMKEYKKQMKEIAQDVFYNEMSDNPCIGY